MPTYQWRCEKCEHVTEVVHKMADCKKQPPCEKCKGEDMFMVFHNAVRPEFKPFVCEHLDREPITIESREHFKKECDKRGMISHWLGNEAKELPPEESKRQLGYEV